MSKKTKNRYFLIYDEGSETARYATVSLEEALEFSEVGSRIKEVTLRQWVLEQLSWENDGTDLERDAGIYEWAAKLAAEDLEAEAAE